MALPNGPIAAYRRYWLPEAIVLSVLVVATIVVFAVTDLDISSARPFYHPDTSNPWPVASQPLWLLFYNSAPWITGSLAIAGTVALIAGLVRKEARRFRTHGLFILLCVAIGPGLIVNGILKDHWGRARPRQIAEFGGKHAYTQPLVPSDAHGKSFPCGHCSVGYLYGAGWWIWRRSSLRASAASLGAGLAIGTLLGFGRLAAGGHFLSDNIWSGLIALGVAHMLYYYVLRIPAREDAVSTLYPLIERDSRYRYAAITGASLLGAGILIGGIVASPHFIDLGHRVRLDAYPARPEVIEIRAERLDVELVTIGDLRDEVSCSGSVHGFGLPTNTLVARWEYRATPVPALLFSIARKGWFPDIDGIARIELPRHGVKKIIVRVDQGDIILTAGPEGGGGPPDLPALDLETNAGKVRR